MKNVILPKGVTGSRRSAGHRRRYGNNDWSEELC